MSRFRLALLLLLAIAGGISVPPAGAGDGAVLRVPQDYSGVQEAVDAAAPGDIILLDRGSYPGDVEVPRGKDNVTIRGVDRNKVVFDGQNERLNAIDVEADGVTLENMSAHNFEANGFYWDGADGFTGRYLTVWNVGLYGIYAIRSHDGLIEDSYVSGAADAAFYIGECKPCDTTLSRLIARYSSIGYSGTNASDGIVISDSLWEFNGTAIMPNSYNEENFPPQGAATISGNTIRDSGVFETPNTSPLGGYIGIGIAIAGGVDNVVEDNIVTGSTRYGIALYPTVQRQGPPWTPSGNIIRGNTVEGSFLADLALSAGSGLDNCFEDNDHGQSLPIDIESILSCGSAAGPDGDESVAAQLAVPVPVALDRLGPRPSYATMPEPPQQPNMPGTTQPKINATAEDEAGLAPEARAEGDSNEWLPWLAGGAAGFILALLLVTAWSKARRRSDG